LLSIISIITNAFGLYCESGGFDFHFAYVYLEAFDFIAISVTLYGLFVFYGLTREELKGRRPLAKFLSIKLIIFLTFYQSFMFSILEKTGTIKATTYWTQTNVANGLNALCTCVEMVFFSLFMLWSYPAGVYYREGKGHTLPFRGILDSLNFSDFAIEIGKSLKYFFNVAFCRSNKKPFVPFERDENDTKLQARPAVNRGFDSTFGISGPTYGRSLRRRTSDDDHAQPFLYKHGVGSTSTTVEGFPRSGEGSVQPDLESRVMDMDEIH